MKRVDISATASATVTIGAAGTGGSNGVLSGPAGGPGYLYVIEY